MLAAVGVGASERTLTVVALPAAADAAVHDEPRALSSEEVTRRLVESESARSPQPLVRVGASVGAPEAEPRPEHLLEGLGDVDGDGLLPVLPAVGDPFGLVVALDQGLVEPLTENLGFFPVVDGEHRQFAEDAVPKVLKCCLDVHPNLAGGVFRYGTLAIITLTYAALCAKCTMQEASVTSVEL